MDKKSNRKLLNVLLLSGFFVLSGCSSMKTTNRINGEQNFTMESKGSLAGAVAGAGIGSLAGGAGTLFGAGVGAGIGAFTGYTMDQTRERLSNELDQLGISVKMVDDVIVVNLSNDLLFKKSSPELNEQSKNTLNKFIEIVNGLDDQNATIKVIGHTDDTGTLMYNIALSEQRAKNVAFYLFNKGVKGDKTGILVENIDYSGVANYEPLVNDTTKEARDSNRRVEIKIYHTSLVN